MTGAGHVLTGGALTTAVLVTLGVAEGRHFLPALAIALFATLLPDLDGRSSLLQGWLKGSRRQGLSMVAGLLPRSNLLAYLFRASLSVGESLLRCLVVILLWLLHRLTGHRGALHSLVALWLGTAIVTHVVRSQA